MSNQKSQRQLIDKYQAEINSISGIRISKRLARELLIENGRIVPKRTRIRADDGTGAVVGELY
jgi:hypothetical protein